MAAAYFYGLPEQKIEEIIMENIHVTYAEILKKMFRLCWRGIEPMSRKGILAKNIGKLTIRNVEIDNPDGLLVDLAGVDKIITE